MKKHIFILPIVLLSVSACNSEDLHLTCYSNLDQIPSTDSTVKESYDVYVKFLEDGAVLTVDGVEYELKQEYDAPVAFYRFDPWYNFQIGNRSINRTSKYSLGIPSNEGFARYTTCEEAK